MLLCEVYIRNTTLTEYGCATFSKEQQWNSLYINILQYTPSLKE